MPHRPRLTTRWLGAAVAVALLAGCSPGLAVDAYPTKPGSDVDCRALYADAPRRVAGEDIIRVKEDNAVAWGAPAIVMRCGVEVPVGYTATSECYPVGDLCWFSEETADGYLFTVTGRELFVSLEIPDDYAPYADPLGDVEQAIEEHVPEQAAL